MAWSSSVATAGTTRALGRSATLEGDLVDNTSTQFYRVSLTANTTYTFNTDLTNYSLHDSVVSLYNAAGERLRYDDDSGEGWESRLSFTPTTSGTYYLEVGSYASYYSGTYSVSLTAENEAAALTGAANNFANGRAGTTYTISRAALLAGFTDADGDTLSVTNLTASSGTLTATSTGWTLTGVAAPTTGSTRDVTLSYNVNDGHNHLTEATSSVSFTAPTATAAIIVTRNDLVTTEAGGTAVINVKLATNPNGNVVFGVRSGDTTEGTVSTSNITLNSTNWQTGVNVTVTGVQDYDNDGDESYNIYLTGNAASTTSPAYTTAIRAYTTGRSYTLTNNGDLTDTGVDRDTPVYTVGDSERPREDFLVGNDGADRLYGGYMVDDVRGGIGNDRLYGGYEDDYIYGGDGSDQLYGEQDDDRLFGGAGNDRMDGGIGSDTLTGGAGNDVYYVTLNDDGGIEDTIVELANEGSDTVYIPFQVEAYVAPANVEVIRMNAGFSDTAVTGNTSNNTIVGNAGSNTLDGGTGNDTLNGGAGADAVVGGIGNDIVDGGTGNDTVAGGTGTDRLVGGTGNDTVDGGSDNDTIAGGTGADRLTGGTGNDAVDGGSDNDTIAGGTGADRLTGGTGTDTFTYSATGELSSIRSASDAITDFVSGTDRINLSAIDANTVLTGNQAFAFTSVASFTGFTGAGQLILDRTSHVLYGNTSGGSTSTRDYAPEFVVSLNTNIVATDIVL